MKHVLLVALLFIATPAAGQQAPLKHSARTVARSASPLKHSHGTLELVHREIEWSTFDLIKYDEGWSVSIFGLKHNDKTQQCEMRLMTAYVDETARVVLWTGPPGDYAVIASSAEAQPYQELVTILGPPGPQPPVPPTPPNPPTPSVLPFPAKGLTVMIIVEESEKANMPPAQRAILTSSQVMGYLRDHCVKLADGGPAARVWDDDFTDANLRNAEPEMITAYKAMVKASNGIVPWIGICDGKKGFSGPLPGSIRETLQLLHGFGG